MRELTRLTKALADPNRLRILGILGKTKGEICACQIIEVLRLAPSTVSRHMALLEGAGLVEVRVNGRWHHYRLAGRTAPAPVRRALAFAKAALADETQIARDLKKLRAARGPGKPGCPT